jgi:dynein heavy chain
MKKECKETVPSQVNALAHSLMKLLDCYFEAYKDTEYKKVSAEDIEGLEAILENIFFFCLVWSVGCTTDLDGRRKFNTYIRELMVQNKATIEFPSGLVYDFSFNK